MTEDNPMMIISPKAFTLKKRFYLLFLTPFLLGGCAALDSGHYPTDMQRRVYALAAHQKILAVSSLGNDFLVSTGGLTVFNDSSNKKTVHWNINKKIVSQISQKINSAGKFTLSTLGGIEASQSQDTLSEITLSDLLELAKKANASLLLRIVPESLIGGQLSYGYSQQHLTFTNIAYGDFYLVVVMKLYSVSSGKLIASVEEKKQSKRYHKDWKRDPNKWSHNTLALAKKEITNAVPKIVNSGLLDIGLLQYPTAK